jgi:hypothetical protein
MLTQKLWDNKNDKPMGQGIRQDLVKACSLSKVTPEFFRSPAPFNAWDKLSIHKQNLLKQKVKDLI